MAITLNGDSGITNVNGTAAAPAITGTDTDSGMYFGTNTVALSTAGTAALSINSSQVVSLANALPVASGGTGSTSTTYCNLASNVTGTLPVANGGTGAATLTANNVLLGNGTSAIQAVAPSTSGNVLTSNGTTWTSAAPPSSTPTTAQVLSATAGASVGAVGTYAFLSRQNGATSLLSAGSTLDSLGNLAYSNGGNGTNAQPSGTWRLMGALTGSSTQNVSLWLRIA